MTHFLDSGKNGDSLWTNPVMVRVSITAQDLLMEPLMEGRREGGSRGRERGGREGGGVEEGEGGRRD